jgi:hypothetical protein
MLIGPEGSAGEIGFLRKLMRGSEGDNGNGTVTQVVKPQSVEVALSKNPEGPDDITSNEAEI